MGVFSDWEGSTLPKTVKAMWISQFDLTLMCVQNGEHQRDLESYRAHVVLMMSKLRMMGFNTVFVQVRPNADSLYPSSLFPPSAYAVGRDENFSYDPLAILITEAKSASLSVHAWINPLRGMTVTSRQATNTAYPVGRWIAQGTPFVHAVGGYYYLDPAYDEVRTLIAQGAQEVLTHYEMDGLHIDDYFYPTTDEGFDRQAYQAYLAQGGRASLADFRRENTQALVATLCRTAHDNGVLFGISPGGNIERNRNELYADVAAWCRAGLMDYLCPQIYFGMEHQTHPFAEVARAFSNMVADTEIALILGMTLEKAARGYAGESDIYAGSGKDEWIENRNVLLQCLQATKEMPACRGVAYFSYRLFYSPTDGSEYLPTAEERSHWLPAFSAIE